MCLLPGHIYPIYSGQPLGNQKLHLQSFHSIVGMYVRVPHTSQPEPTAKHEGANLSERQHYFTFSI